MLRSEDQIEVKAADISQLERVLQHMPGIHKIQSIISGLLLSCDQAITPQQINEYCINNGIVLSHLVLKKKSLETKFMELTN